MKIELNSVEAAIRYMTGADGSADSGKPTPSMNM